MQTIGLIGGITPQSTILYYEVLNSLASKQFGSLHSCKVIINSVDFGEIAELQKSNHWGKLEDIMCNAASSLEKAGAGLILICANTMHLTIDAVKNTVSIPVIHIAEVTAEQILVKGIKKVALLGTKFTMELPFYKNIVSTFGIETIIPGEKDREVINTIIYDELTIGLLKETSKNAYLKIIDKLINLGAEGVILGCTEIPLLIKQSDVVVPVFDTTTIHATKAFNLALIE